MLGHNSMLFQMLSFRRDKKCFANSLSELFLMIQFKDVKHKLVCLKLNANKHCLLRSSLLYVMKIACNKLNNIMLLVPKWLL